MVAAKGSGWTTGANALGKSVALGPASLTKAYSGTLTAGTGVSSGVGASGVAVSKTIGSSAAGEMAVVANGLLTGANIFTAFRAIIGGPPGALLTAVIISPAVIDWLIAGGYRFKSDQSGDLEKLGTDTNYKLGAYSGRTKQDACDAYVAGNYKPTETLSFSGLHGDRGCAIIQDYHPKPPAVGSVQAIGYLNTYKETIGLADPSKPENWFPASMDDIAPYMTPRPVPPPVVQALLDAGAAIPIVYPKSPEAESGTYFPPGVLSVVGPASVLGTATVTKTNDGTNTKITTTTPKTTLSYSTSTNSEGKSVPTVTATAGSTTVVTITNNTTNVTTTESDTEVTAPAEDKEDLGTISDTAFGDIPKLYERKYPDGLTGIWSDKINGIKATPLFNLLSQISPVFGSTGTCPNWHLPMDIASWAGYGSLDVSPPCWVWDFGKVVIVCSALLLARRLVFGG